MQEVYMELTHCDFFCPMTGQRLLGKGALTASPATVFAYFDESRSFGMIQGSFKTIADSLAREQTDRGDTWFESFCDRVHGQDNVIVFTITTRGAECGPVDATIRIGIDTSALIDD